MIWEPPIRAELRSPSSSTVVRGTGISTSANGPRVFSSEAANSTMKFFGYSVSTWRLRTLRCVSRFPGGSYGGR
jgi:hypothetical protein